MNLGAWGVLVFVHGAGRSGAAAWPRITRTDALFLDLAPTASVESQVEVMAAAVQDSAVVVAHSHGAIPAVLALPILAERLRSLVLVEPALYDVARGVPAIERHIATMEAARRAGEAEGLRAYWRIVRPLMFGGDYREQLWAEEEPVASRFFAVVPPWGFGISAVEVVRVPTVVVTGGWNDEYEAIAAALTREGAEHRVIAGARHRPQDDPGFESVLAAALSR